MFETGKTLAGRAVMERLVLLINHLLAAEPAAVERLRRHVGRSVSFRFDGWPSLLPALPVTVFRVSPAGLVEWVDESGAAESGAAGGAADDLVVGVDASNPAATAWRALTGQKRAVTVAGNAAFAADLNWLFENLRWDIEDDLSKVLGDAPARELARVASAVSAALRRLTHTLRRSAAPADPDAAEPPPTSR